MAKTFEQFKTETTARFEKIYLIPFEWMEVSNADVHIAFTTGDSPKGFVIALGVAMRLRLSIPD